MPGSVEYEAVLLHEQVHSKRQGSFDGHAEAIRPRPLLSRLAPMCP